MIFAWSALYFESQFCRISSRTIPQKNGVLDSVGILTMKAVHIDEFGDAGNLSIREVEALPEPAGTRVLVNVKAAALNRADLLQRQGLYPAPVGYPERIPGLEFAGTVAAVGERVTNVAIGDRVCGITAGGAQAEFLSIDESLLVKIPANLSFVEASAIPEAFITAHDAIISQGGLARDQTLLIHAVGSGVGLAALQIAKAVGAKVIGTSRTADKLDRCVDFGLDAGLSGEDFADHVVKLTNGRGANVILDLVGAKVFSGNLKCAALKGRIVLVGLVGGRKAEFDLGIALTKRLSIIGTVLRSRSLEEKADATRKFAENVIPLIASGKIVANVDRVFRASDVSEAHRYLESNQSFGKVVLEL